MSLWLESPSDSLFRRLLVVMIGLCCCCCFLYVNLCTCIATTISIIIIRSQCVPFSYLRSHIFLYSHLPIIAYLSFTYSLFFCFKYCTMLVHSYTFDRYNSSSGCYYSCCLCCWCCWCCCLTALAYECVFHAQFFVSFHSSAVFPQLFFHIQAFCISLLHSL